MTYEPRTRVVKAKAQALSFLMPCPYGKVYDTVMVTERSAQSLTGASARSKDTEANPHCLTGHHIVDSQEHTHVPTM
jgi:hypothetical protein